MKNHKWLLSLLLTCVPFQAARSQVHSELAMPPNGNNERAEVSPSGSASSKSVLTIMPPTFTVAVAPTAPTTSGASSSATAFALQLDRDPQLVNLFDKTLRKSGFSASQARSH